MAKFKLSFIVPNNDDIFTGLQSDEKYIKTIITDYLDQKQEYKENQAIELDKQSNILSVSTVTYTYDEKISLHKNAQKELTFSMDDKVFVNNEWVENPYARVLRVGCQLELKDKYDNIMLFTINKVQYNLKNLNIVYNITCQDSFSYQLNRQNNGYNLVNDENSSDFIGALDIDEWAYKIEKECYITYQYIPLDTGIYLDNDGVLHTYEVPGDDIQNAVSPTGMSNVKKIIKPIYNKNNYPDFYETFPFSVSGSSANAALISAAETLGLQLQVVEGLSEPAEIEVDSVKVSTGKPTIYKKFFYMAPTKNPDASGLTYSPLREVQNFSLNFAGDSLTTVLNIKSTTWNEEEIGLFPELPGFFCSLFMDNEWIKSSYYPGYFTECVKGLTYGTNTNETNLWDDEDNWYDVTIDNENYKCLKLNRSIRWPKYYNKVRFYWEDKQYFTNIQVGNDYITPFQSNNALFFSFGTIDNSDPAHPVIESIYSHYAQEEEINYNDVQSWLRNEGVELFLSVKAPLQGFIPSIQTFFIQLTRDYTEDELTFAKIADTCPWLENKLIDFSYFVKQGLISRIEYEGLMNWLLNDLRIINGQLMCYSTSYYQALHKQVQYVAELQSSLDLLGASFNSDIVEPYTKTGAMKENKSDFVNNYNLLFNVDTPPVQDLINLHSIISDTFNKYFNAQQRFLKNMYEFRKYFDSKNIYALTNDVQLQDVVYNLNDSVYNETIDGVTYGTVYTFTNAVKWERLTSQSPIIYNDTRIENEGEQNEQTHTYRYVCLPLYKYTNSHYKVLKTPNPQNYKEFYVPLITKNTITNVEEGHQYNSANIYYVTATWYENNIGEIPNSRLIVIDDIEYVQLLYHDIVKIFLMLQSASGDNQLINYYVRDTDTYVPFDWVRTNPETIQAAIDIAYWPGMTILRALNKDLNKNNSVSTIAKNSKRALWELYKALTPLDEVYIHDYNLDCRMATDSLDQQYYTFTIRDFQNKEYKYDNVHNQWTNAEDEIVNFEDLYKKYYAIPFLQYQDSNGSLLWNTDSTTTVTWAHLMAFGTSSLYDNTKYYSHYITDAQVGWSIAGAVAVGVTCPFLLPAAGLLASMGIIVGNFVANNSIKDIYSTWGQKDDTDYNCMYYGYNDSYWKWYKLQLNSSRKQDQQNLGNTGHYRGDSHWPNYVKSEDSEAKLREYVTAWIENGGDFYTQIDADNKTNYKHYFNYYKHIVATYSQGAATGHTASRDLSDDFDSEVLLLRNYGYEGNKSWDRDFYWIKNKYARFCKLTDQFNYQDDYIWVPANAVKIDQNNFVVGNRFSTIKFYPLITKQDKVNFKEAFVDVDLSNNDYTINQYLQKLSDSIGDKNKYKVLTQVEEWSEFEKQYKVRFTIPNEDDDTGEHPSQDLDYYIVHLEPYEKRMVSLTDTNWQTLPTSPHRFHIYYQKVNHKVYHLETDKELKPTEIIFNNFPELWDNDDFRYLPAQDAQLVQICDFPVENQEGYWTNDETHWYATNEIESRTYSVNQLVQAHANSSDSADFEDNIPKVYYLANTAYNAADFVDSTNYTSRQFEITRHTYIIQEDQFILDNEKDTQTITWDTNQVGPIYVEQWNAYLNITRTLIKNYQIGKMTNGEFWYAFHNRMDISDILEKAAVIETQLEVYWQQAYTASQYCEYFIPEHWQDYTESSTNYWASGIWKILEYIPHGSTKQSHIVLNNKIIPDVSIYSLNHQTVLTNYTYNYREDVIPTAKAEYEIEDISVLKSNPALQDALSHIMNTDVGDATKNGRFTAQEYGTRTYYYRTSGGLLRKDVTSYLDNTCKSYIYYDGLYCMQLRLLMTRFINTPTHSYETTLNNKLAVWRKLYSRYPGIFLENTYENKDVRSSEQLLKMAQLAFKDYTSPEKQYNITLIDAAALEGYEGQELHIGDGILLRTSDYYDAIDETYRALNQYLFISDINYSLRKDTDIGLTVNIIKYQDKLLQSIVKLIR